MRKIDRLRREIEDTESELLDLEADIEHLEERRKRRLNSLDVLEEELMEAKE